MVIPSVQTVNLKQAYAEQRKQIWAMSPKDTLNSYLTPTFA